MHVPYNSLCLPVPVGCFYRTDTHDVWPGAKTRIASVPTRLSLGIWQPAFSGVIAVGKSGGLPFDAVLTGELVHAYKPSPEVYVAAAGFLGFKPEQIMMVAYHKWDLKGAKAVGLKTAFIPRPLENGPGHPIDSASEPFIDIVALDFIDLAAKLSA
jgi:2-haloacid dehalogenase